MSDFKEVKKRQQKTKEEDGTELESLSGEFGKVFITLTKSQNELHTRHSALIWHMILKSENSSRYMHVSGIKLIGRMH